VHETTAAGGVIGGVGDVADGVLSRQAKACPHVIVDEALQPDIAPQYNVQPDPLHIWERFAPVLSYTNREGAPWHEGAR